MEDMTHSRKTRSRDYKEKKGLTLFGRLILPFTLILALALLYFSIKLFLAPEKAGLRAHQQAAETVASADSVLSSGDQAEEPAASADAQNGSGTGKQTGSVKAPAAAAAKSQPGSAAQNKNSVQAKPQTKTVSAGQKKDNSAKAVSPAPAGNTAKPRWDVQIGVFAAKSGAELTAKQARNAGYSSYITETVLDGKTHYRVRVRGSADKAASSELSKRLEKAGFPIYLVYIN